MLNRWLCSTKTRDRGRILLTMLLERRSGRGTFVNDAIVDVGVRFVQRLALGLARGVRSCDDTLRSCQLDGGLNSGGAEVHGIVKGRCQIMGAWRYRLLARAALRGDCGFDEAILLAGCGRSTGDINGLGLPFSAREKVGHEAGHDERAPHREGGQGGVGRELMTTERPAKQQQ